MAYDTFDETITVYTEIFDPVMKLKRWKGTVVKNCSWYGGSAANVDSSGLNLASRFKVRVKKPDIPENLEVRTGSLVILGEYPGSVSKISDITDKDDCFKVLAIHKNFRGPKGMQHLMIEGG